jgi:hypothetical protein
MTATEAKPDDESSGATGAAEEVPAHAAGQKDTSAVERAEAGSGPSAAAVNNDKVKQVVNNYFNADTTHANAGQGPEHHRRTGRLDDIGIRSAREHYVEPVGYDQAAGALLDDHVVVIVGRRGTGKRAGAISLLREMTGGPLIVIAPTIAPEKLAERRYDEGCGYLVVDHQSPGRTADTDFTWHTVRDQVRDAGAYLVVTTVPNETVPASESVVRVPWAQPDPHAVFMAWLNTAGGTGDDVRSIEEGLPDDYTMTDLVAVARRVAGGEQVKVALDSFDAASMAKVRAWFGEQRTRREILEVTALAFLGGCNERTFESLLAVLAEALAAQMPLPAPDEESGDTVEEVLPQRRHAMLGADSLITVEHNWYGGMPRRTVAFRAPTYQRHVLAELSNRVETAFWDAVRQWLDAILTIEHSRRIASGLSALSTVAFEEVYSSYLEPWSKQDLNWSAQTTAIYVLWSMCADEALAPVALYTALKWSFIGDAAQRWTTMMAFTGDLALSYPAEAANRLWHLMVQGRDRGDDAGWALVELFTTLATNSDDAGIVLVMLDMKCRIYCRADADRVVRELTMSAVFAILSIRGIRSVRSSVFGFLQVQPARLEVVARLWAAVLCFRPKRRRALIVLLERLGDLSRVEGDPGSTIHAVAHSLAEALPPDEHEPFAQDLRTVVKSHRWSTNTPADQPAGLPVDSLAAILIKPLADTATE